MLNAARNLKIHFIFIGFIFMSYGYPAMADQTCPKVGDVYTGPPSADAKGMPGALGVREYTPCDWQRGKVTWWIDTDGVKPGIAGCHVETTSEGKPQGRHFGEACLDDGVLLVESNPSADKLHTHRNDIGHPDVFNCNIWCRGTESTSGALYSGGSCKTVTNDVPPPCAESAMCVCDK